MKKILLLFVALVFTVSISQAQGIDFVVLSDSTAAITYNGKSIVIPGNYVNGTISSTTMSVDSTLREGAEILDGVEFPPKGIPGWIALLWPALPAFQVWWVRGTRVWGGLKPYFVDFGTNSIVIISSLILGAVYEIIVSLPTITDFSAADWTFYSLFTYGISIGIYELTKSFFGKTPKAEEVKAELSA